MEINPALIYEAYTDHPWPEVVEWCEQNVGNWNEGWHREPQDIAAVTVGYNKTRYFFKTEQDRTMFILKWGS
jgi:hypothetical protein